MTFELNMGIKCAHPAQFHIPEAHWSICKMVTSEEGQKSQDIKGCIDSLYFNNGNLIVPAAKCPSGQGIFSLGACGAAVAKFFVAASRLVNRPRTAHRVITEREY